MDHMMDSMMCPFDTMFPPLGFGPMPNNANEIMPFARFAGHNLFPSVNNMFDDIQQMAANNPNCHSYSSSSVMSYTFDEVGHPQVYEVSSSTRNAPGGVRETRKTLRDSKTGEQKMAIGHHIQDRAHIVEKCQNTVTGQRDETQEYVNIEEDEAEDFNREWINKARGPRINAMENNFNVEITEIPTDTQLAITVGPRHSDRNHYNHSRRRGRQDVASDLCKSSHRNRRIRRKKA
ncbi:Mlf (predicted) [Pycnogonum litorale]